MSAGVGHISLTKQEESQETQEQPPPRRRPLLTFRQLNVVALLLVLSASGMVAVEDLAFVLFSSLYMYFISKVAFPTLDPPHSPPVFAENNRLLRIYVAVGALFGLILPVAYIVEGFVEGDKEGIKAATPHVFLLASQVLMEGVAFSDRFSIPIRVFVPVVYNSVRIFSLMQWVKSEISKVEEENHGSRRRLYMGRGLAVANMAFWSFNLFGFLLPVYLPRAFKKYYGEDGKRKD